MRDEYDADHINKISLIKFEGTHFMAHVPVAEVKPSTNETMPTFQKSGASHQFQESRPQIQSTCGQLREDVLNARLSSSSRS